MSESEVHSPYGLALSSAQAQLLFEAHNLHFWSWDLPRKAVRVSAGWCQFLGRPVFAAALVVDEWRELVHPDDISRVDAVRSHAVKSGSEAYEVELRLRAANDSWQWVVERGVVTRRDPSGEGREIVGSHSDITLRKLRDLEVGKQRSILRAFIEHAPAAIAMFDRDTRYLAASAAWGRMYGIDPAELVGREHYDAVADGAVERERWEQAIARGIRGEVVSAAREEWPRRVSGAQKIVHWACHPWRDDRGDIGGVVMLIDDVTAAVMRETQIERLRHIAEEARHAKDRYIATVSHEIRTPLTAIVGYSEIALDERSFHEERDEAVQIIASSGKHLIDIVNDVLDLAKLEAGKVQLERVPFSPSEVVADVLSLLVGQFNSKGVAIQCDTSSVRGLIGDPMRFRQIITNLVSNALKFTERGSVTVCLRYANAALSIEVVDTGRGLTQGEMARIFQPFEQANSATQREFGGTGLGLSICKELVSMMGGEIGVRATPGGGATFVVTLPLPEATCTNSGSVRMAKRSEMTKPLIRAAKILVVDDAVLNRRLIEASLRSLPVVVLGAGSVAEAVELARKNDVDLILLDMRMPGVSGYQGVPLLRQVDSTTPIIAFTAIVGDEQQSLSAAGCDGLLPKPFTRAQLLEILERHLED